MALLRRGHQNFVCSSEVLYIERHEEADHFSPDSTLLTYAGPRSPLWSSCNSSHLTPENAKQRDQPTPASLTVQVLPGQTYTTLYGIQIITPPQWHNWNGQPQQIFIERHDPNSFSEPFPLAVGERYISAFYTIHSTEKLITAKFPFIIRVLVLPNAGQRVLQNEFFCFEDDKGTEGQDTPYCGWSIFAGQEGGVKFIDYRIKEIPSSSSWTIVTTAFTPEPSKQS